MRRCAGVVYYQVHWIIGEDQWRLEGGTEVRWLRRVHVLSESCLSRVDCSSERPRRGQWLAAAWRTRLAVRGDKLPWLLLGAARRTRIARWSNATNTSRTPRPRNACPVLLPENTPTRRPTYPTTHLPTTWSSSSTAGAHTIVQYIHTYIIHPLVVTSPYDPPPHTFSDTHTNTGHFVVGAVCNIVTATVPRYSYANDNDDRSIVIFFFRIGPVNCTYLMIITDNIIPKRILIMYMVLYGTADKVTGHNYYYRKNAYFIFLIVMYFCREWEGNNWKWILFFSRVGSTQKQPILFGDYGLSWKYVNQWSWIIIMFIPVRINGRYL